MSEFGPCAYLSNGQVKSEATCGWGRLHRIVLFDQRDRALRPVLGRIRRRMKRKCDNKMEVGTGMADDVELVDLWRSGRLVAARTACTLYTSGTPRCVPGRKYNPSVVYCHVSLVYHILRFDRKGRTCGHTVLPRLPPPNSP